MIQFTTVNGPASGSFNVTPLVDVVFILLIFFLLTSNATRGIVLDLPDASTGEAIPTETWEVAITADSRILFNGVEVEGSKLLSVLETARRRAPTLQIVVLRADRSASVGDFIMVMDTIRRTGFYNLVIATDPKPGAHEHDW